MHVDDFINMPASHWVEDKEVRYATWILSKFRLCETLQAAWQEFYEGRQLYCTYKGKRFRVTGASRLGDIWLHSDFTVDCGYEHRVDVAECSAWGSTSGS